MKPSQLVQTLRRIASGIENSKQPSKELVARDLKKVALLLNQYTLKGVIYPFAHPQIWEITAAGAGGDRVVIDGKTLAAKHPDLYTIMDGIARVNQKINGAINISVDDMCHMNSVGVYQAPIYTSGMNIKVGILVGFTTELNNNTGFVWFHEPFDSSGILDGEYARVEKMFSNFSKDKLIVQTHRVGEGLDPDPWWGYQCCLQLFWDAAANGYVDHTKAAWKFHH